MKRILTMVQNLATRQKSTEKHIVSEETAPTTVKSTEKVLRSNDSIRSSAVNKEFTVDSSTFFGVDKPINKIGRISDNKELTGIVAKLNTFLGEKNVMPKDVFDKKLWKKDKGISSGNIAKRKEDKQIFMLKEGEKEKDSITFLREFVAAPLFKRLLNDSAPVIGLAADNATVQSLNYNNPSANIAKSKLTSKFLPNFNDLESLYKKKGGKEMIERAQGWEKVLLASVFMGDVDFHGENLGVIQNSNESPKIAKIDHGYAFKLFAEEKSLIEALQYLSLDLSEVYKKKASQYSQGNKHDAARRMRYFSDLYKTLNIENLRIAAEEISTISIDEINNMIDNRIDILKKTEFKLEGVFTFKLDSFASNPLCVNYTPGNELDTVRDSLKLSMAVQLEKIKELPQKLREFSSRAGAKNDDIQWSNGAWLEEMTREESFKRKSALGPWSAQEKERKDKAQAKDSDIPYTRF